jgi:hypothetical protein
VKSITDWKQLGKDSKRDTRKRWKDYLLEDMKIMRMRNWTKNKKKSLT